MKNLTLKQERFVKALVEGKSQRQAYKEAYPGSEKWKPENNIFKVLKEKLPT